MIVANREDFVLRPMIDEDLPLVREWRNSERVRANMYTDHLISPDEHKAWFAKAKSDASARYFIFEYKGAPVGVVNIVPIDERNKKCYWGFYLGEANAPKTSGPAMEYLALDHMFENLGMRKVNCEVFVFNESVIKLHKKFGFVEEGIFAAHVWKKDRYEDVASLAIFRETWELSKQRLEKVCFRG